MIKRNLGWIITGIMLILLLLLSGCTTTPSPDAQTGRPYYIVGIDGEYPPYSYIEPDGTPMGFDVESIIWIGEQKGFDVKIQPMAWDGIIPALQAGKIDMVYSGMTITDERKEMVNFSDPYYKVNQSVVAYQESGKTMNEFLAGSLKIGAQRGTTGAFWVEDHLIDTGLMPALNLVMYDNFPIVVQDLQNRRLDAIIYDTTPMLEAIAGKPLIEIGEIDTGEEIGVAIRKEDTELLTTINEGLSQLKNDPYWETLKEKYKM